tara:strand:- start:365 stop:643 length:279 start_codon:yes stop_codon:yes gene_type:complete
MKYTGNKVSSCVNEMCEGQKVQKPKSKSNPEKVFIGYKKSSKSKGKKKSNAELFKEHKKHHTKKHITEMKKLIKKGKTFDEAHREVMKKFGK